MKQHQGVWFPDGERAMTEWMTKNGEVINGKGTYQIRKLRAAIACCKQFRTAVDIGAHVGLWSMHLAYRFKAVWAFEPVAEFRNCYVHNVPQLSAILKPYALGFSAGYVTMKIDPADTGGTHVLDGASERDIVMRALDSFNIQDVDFIKVDCEGYEYQALKGGEETLKRCKPCVIVEQKQHIMDRNYGTKGTPAVDYLKSLGAKQRKVISGDHILTWD